MSLLLHYVCFTQEQVEARTWGQIRSLCCCNMKQGCFFFLNYYYDLGHFIKIDQPGLMQDWLLWICKFTLKKNQFVSKKIYKQITQGTIRTWISVRRELRSGIMFMRRVSTTRGMSAAMRAEKGGDKWLAQSTMTFGPFHGKRHPCPHLFSEALIRGQQLLSGV